MRYEEAFYTDDDGHQYLKEDFPRELTPEEQAHVEVLYNHYQATHVLNGLRSGDILPDDEDILALWHVLQDSAGYVGAPPTLKDFGKFLSEGAEVTW